MLHKTAEYGLRTIVWMARSPEQVHTSRDIALGTRVPSRYLYKVLQSLAAAGLIHSQPGPGGGYRLDGDPDSVTLFDVVNAISPIRQICACPLGLRAHKRLCPLHRRLNRAFGSMEKALAETTIGQVLREHGSARPLAEAQRGN